MCHINTTHILRHKMTCNTLEMLTPSNNSTLDVRPNSDTQLIFLFSEKLDCMLDAHFSARTFVGDKNIENSG